MCLVLLQAQLLFHYLFDVMCLVLLQAPLLFHSLFNVMCLVLFLVQACPGQGLINTLRVYSGISHQKGLALAL